MTRFTLTSLVLTRVSLAVAAASLLLRSAPAAETIVDLTHPFDARAIYWPTEKGFTLDKGPAGVTERGYFYAANRFAAPEHGGTHIDAPYPFLRDRTAKRSTRSRSPDWSATAFASTPQPDNALCKPRLPRYGGGFSRVGADRIDASAGRRRSCS